MKKTPTKSKNLNNFNNINKIFKKIYILLKFKQRF